MGGFASAASELFTKVGTKIPEMLRRTDSGTVIHDISGAKDDLFRLDVAHGENIRQLHMGLQLSKAQWEKKLDAPLQKLQNDLYQHPTLSREVKDTTTLGEIHQKMQAAAHPSAPIAAHLLGPNLEYAGKTLKETGIINIAQARVRAANDVLGPKMQNLIPFIMDSYDSGVPTRMKWADSVMSLFSNELHDTTSMYTQAGKIEVSRVKMEVGKAFKRENKVREQLAELGEEHPTLRNVSLKPTYENSTQLERRVQNVLRTVQLPFVALKHLSQYGNLSSIHAGHLVSGLLNMGDKQFKQFLDESAILAYTEHDMLDKNISGRFGKVAQWTSNPTAGDLFYRSYHMPLFDTLRHFQLSASASVGYNASVSWAKQALNGNKRALLELKEMGIDPAEVIKNKGILSDAQKVQAMFHFTNNRFFMDKSIERSMRSNSTPFWRSATMYHTFVNAQQRFMRRELNKMLAAGDFVGIAQFAGTIGVLFPAVAPFLKSLELFARTASPTQAEESVKEDYDKLFHGSFKDRTNTYIDLLAHYGAFGVYTSYVAASHGDRLAYAILGPTIGVAARAGSDLINMVTRTNAAGKHNAAPVVRDIFEDTLPIAGNIIGHQVAPTAREAEIGKAKRTPRPRRSGRGFKNRWEF